MYRYINQMNISILPITKALKSLHKRVDILKLHDDVGLYGFYLSVKRA